MNTIFIVKVVGIKQAKSFWLSACYYKYIINITINTISHITPRIRPSGLWPSGWYWCLGPIQGVIWKKVYIILLIPGINIRYIHLCSSSEVLNVIKCVFIECTSRMLQDTWRNDWKRQFVRKVYDVNVSAISGRKIHKNGKADISKSISVFINVLMPEDIFNSPERQTPQEFSIYF